MSFSVTAVDPPQGWARWSRTGPTMMQFALKESAFDSFVEFDQISPSTMYAVEKPFAGMRQIVTTQSIISQAESAGEWSMLIRERVGARAEREQSSTWRSRLGLSRGSSEYQNEMVCRLMRKAYGELGISWPAPRGGAWEHACNAAAFGLSLYLANTEEPTMPHNDAAWKWKRTGSFV